MADETDTPPLDPILELEELAKLQKGRLAIDSEIEKKLNKLLPSMTDEVKAQAEVLKALASLSKPQQLELEPHGRQLENLADCRRALKFVIRRIENGSLETKRGMALVFGLQSLAKLFQDKRDSMWTKRAEQLWKEREQYLASKKPQQQLVSASQETVTVEPTNNNEH